MKRSDGSVGSDRSVRFTIGVAFATLIVFIAWGRSALEAPEPTVLLRDRHGRFLGEVGTGSDDPAGFWPLTALPERVVAATLAIEDRRFWNHPGIDPLAAGRAFVDNLRQRRRVSGASTIAMQTVRLQHPGRRSYLRKVAEAGTAALMVARHGRAAVLAHYLRIVPYGNRIHGIGFAARRYLNKPVEDLSWAEIAYLTAIPQAPAAMNPYSRNGHARAQRRAGEILDRLFARHKLNHSELEMARQQVRAIQMPRLERRPSVAMHAILRLEEQLKNPELRTRLHDRPILDTTLDLDTQRFATREAATAVDSLRSHGAGNAAVIVLDRDTAAVRGWVGSTDYFDTSHSGAIDYTRTWRSPGSSLKPFLYALALDHGAITPGSILDDLRRSRNDIINADHRFLGPMLPRFALGNSRNVPAAEVVQRTGLDRTFSFLGDLGIHDQVAVPERYGLGLAIGGLPTTLERLVRGYAMLANDGVLRELTWDENSVRTERRMLQESTARLVTLQLADPEARLPSFARMGSTEYGFPVAVKTGTSSDSRDVWTVAYSPRFIVGAWIGNPDGRAMPNLSAAASSALLVQQILQRLQTEEGRGLSTAAFSTPDDMQTVRICASSGERAGPACSHVVTEWFRNADVPFETCHVHRNLLVDTRSGAPASETTPDDFRAVRTVLDLPPRYARWATASGLAHALYREPVARGVRTDPAIRITSPRNGTRIIRDPEGNPATQTLSLEAIVEPGADQLVWWIDGDPLLVADFPFTARLPLRPGVHRIEARIPFTDIRSQVVHLRVQ